MHGVSNVTQLIYTHLHVQYIDIFFITGNNSNFCTFENHIFRIDIQATPHSSREQGLESTHTRSCLAKCNSLNYIQNSIYKHVYTLQLLCSLIFFVVYVGLIWTFNKCSVYVDVQLFWKLLLAVWKATDNSVFCKLTPHPHSSNQEVLQPHR